VSRLRGDRLRPDSRSSVWSGRSVYGQRPLWSVGEFSIERLRAWDVERIYGYPGDGINGITAGLRHEGGIDFVQVRHEETAAFAASMN
jgi:hypothetical protein